jgi:DNA-binding transcriptional ArsR family regulator
MLSSTNQTRASQQQQLDLVFKALGDQTRRDLLDRLSEGPAMVTELAKPFAMSLPAVGKHLRVLEKAGLVERTITGRVHRCALTSLPLRNAGEWLMHYQQFWDENLDALSTYFQRDSENESAID